MLRLFFLLVVTYDKGGCCAPWLHPLRAQHSCGGLHAGAGPVLCRPWTLPCAPVLSRPCAGALLSDGPEQAARSTTSLWSPSTRRMALSRDFKDVATWNGELNLWHDYARHVRLQWERTPKHKRKLLGPELASKLTAKAWSVTPDLDHHKLSKKNGCKYLLRFLQERLCRTAVPDAGARLEDLLIRLVDQLACL